MQREALAVFVIVCAGLLLGIAAGWVWQRFAPRRRRHRPRSRSRYQDSYFSEKSLSEMRAERARDAAAAQEREAGGGR